MAKIGLAAELAKKAAEAAREEMGAGATSPAPAARAPWRPQVLTQNFDIAAAWRLATSQVAAHYSQVLAHEGLGLALTEVAEVQQHLPNFIADVREGATGRPIRAYTAPELLTLYASQQRRLGVVVDGQV